MGLFEPKDRRTRETHTWTLAVWGTGQGPGHHSLQGQPLLSPSAPWMTHSLTLSSQLNMAIKVRQR